VPDAKARGDLFRKFPALDDVNNAASQVTGVFGEVYKLFVGLSADRTLRAMLENDNGIGFRPLQELLEVTILA
jgi:hypothetical protein